MNAVKLAAHLQRILFGSCAYSIETHEDNSDVAENELLVGGFLRIIVESASDGPPVPAKSKSKPGARVVISPRDPTHPYLDISRLHKAVARRDSARGPSQKTVTAMMHLGSTTDEQMLGLAVYDEDHFIDMILMLFPGGELEPRESDSEHPWPYRKMVWETSDGKEWHHPGLASRHQTELDREVTEGTEGTFNPWYLIKTPEGHGSAGCARTPDELEAIRRGIEMVPGYKFYSGFTSEEDLQVFRGKLGV